MQLSHTLHSGVVSSEPALVTCKNSGCDVRRIAVLSAGCLLNVQDLCLG